MPRSERPPAIAVGNDVAVAVAASNWQKAAEIVNGYDADTMHRVLGKFGRGVVASIHVGALSNPRLGAQSAVAEATRSAYLDINFDNEVRRKSWTSAAKFLNGFNRDDILAHLSKVDATTVKELHDGAVANPEVGPQSQLADVTEMLIARQTNASKPEGEVMRSGDTVRHTGDPMADPRYIEKTTKGIGIPIWGGPLYLKQSDTPGWNDSVVVPRNQFAFVDPFAAQAVELASVYTTREAALKAVRQSGIDGAFAFYLGAGGQILPTVFSATTAPGLTRMAQFAIQGEGKDAKAASRLGIDLLLWYVGARFPTKVGAGPEAATAAQTVKSSLPTILGETEYAALKSAAEAAKAAHPQLASLTVDEIIAIRAYSAESWSYLNQALRLKDAKELTRLGEFINLMKSGLSKLPIYKGTVTRRIGMIVNDALQRYQVGATVTEEAFTSTTFGKAVAQREGNVILTIESQTGRDITAVAVHDESEVLFLPGSKFLVTKVEQFQSAVLIVMKEVL